MSGYRKCYRCGRTIDDQESCWRDGQGRFFCNDCNEEVRGKHDGSTDDA